MSTAIYIILTIWATIEVTCFVVKRHLRKRQQKRIQEIQKNVGEVQEHLSELRNTVGDFIQYMQDALENAKIEPQPHMPTQEEYENVMSAYGDLDVDYSLIPNVVIKGDDGSEFPSKMNLGIKGLPETQKSYDIKWDIGE